MDTQTAAKIVKIILEAVLASCRDVLKRRLKISSGSIKMITSFSDRLAAYKADLYSIGSQEFAITAMIVMANKINGILRNMETLYKLVWGI